MVVGSLFALCTPLCQTVLRSLRLLPLIPLIRLSNMCPWCHSCKLSLNEQCGSCRCLLALDAVIASGEQVVLLRVLLPVAASSAGEGLIKSHVVLNPSVYITPS